MEKQDQAARIRELVEELNKASYAYYQQGREIMSNLEYDRLYDELTALEKKTGIQLSSSPTVRVGYEPLSELPREHHESPMLSLDKTKSPEALAAWLGDHEGVLSWKLDGITIVLTYENGRMVKAVTRGNGEIGEVVTGNAAAFENLPLQIPFQGRLVLRGEAVISYPDFERINHEIPDVDAKYKNPRNLCSGSVRQLDPAVTAGRHVRLVAFQLVSAEPSEIPDSFSGRFEWLKQQGFEVVEYRKCRAEDVPAAVEAFKERIAAYSLPSDGLVLCFDDVAYGLSLGRTAKFPRSSIAFKWQDETAETVLREIEWSASRTGLINPVAVFDPVELEGTSVSRASVHNVSIVRDLALGIGDRLLVYKANMIIPQISENLDRSGRLEIPAHCPVCGGETLIRRENEAETLLCTNPACPAKRLKAFALMVSRDALNIEGLSEMTLEKLIQIGALKEFADLFHLSDHRERITALEGFGEKSCGNLLKAAEKARDTELYRMLYGLGIPGIGLANAKLLSRHFHDDFEAMIHAEEEELSGIRNIGSVLAGSMTAFFADDAKRREAERLLEELHIRRQAPAEEGALVHAEIDGRSYELPADLFSGKTFVITGDVHFFRNRKEVSELIERLGGKTAGSVSSKTSYLINNDLLSGSAKNQKAAELGIPVISEEQFISMFPERP